ncbi:nuclear transport factor 2 family protein [Rhodococcus sp. IEGM 1408]|uniref:nuclear transport factor 2 family protein n=1 Tax=Rhodococcus sp. IEGM 1408 TaxID=3082220 RepID=UPI002955510E|nr:nuclear transport factor 2 family protein [Rhodococcus sp. IEGM 1408]MDV8002448.1 nuclear transport factor 2 family protein [Rhodococcus sp. IEGM 1408]
MSSEFEDSRGGDADSARRVALAWMEAVTSCDEATALALSSPSIVYTNGGHLRSYEGHDGVRDIIEDFARLSGFLNSRVQAVLAEPGIVAIRRVEKYTLPEGGVEIPACSFVEVQDGVVTRWSDYKDMHPMNQFSA